MPRNDLFIERSADFSPCRTWRYTLIRKWGDGGMLLFILLNPSTADEVQDDPTNRRAINFAMDWGFGSVMFVNLFAFRSTSPDAMKGCSKPIGPRNDAWILAMVKAADQVILAWGTHGTHRGRDQEVLRMLAARCPRVPLFTMGTTKHGHPKHILYLPKTTTPIPWRA